MFALSVTSSVATSRESSRAWSRKYSAETRVAPKIRDRVTPSSLSELGEIEEYTDDAATVSLRHPGISGDVFISMQ